MAKQYTVDGFAKEFRAALATGIEKAGKVYVEYEENGADLAGCIAAVNISKAMVALVADIGHGRLLADALLAGPDAIRAVRPYDLKTQREMLDSGVEFLSSDGSPLMVRLGQMTVDQRAQLIHHSGGVRSIGEQRAYIEARKNAVEIASAAAAKAASPVDIHKGYIIIHPSDVPRRFTQADLLSFMQRMV